MAHVFVYGTLKRGGRLNPVLGEESTYIGPAISLEPIYRMVSFGGSFPILLEGGQHRVMGEIYDVTDPVIMRELDRIESGYDRKLIWVYDTQAGVYRLVWIYIGKARDGYSHNRAPEIAPCVGDICIWQEW